jgi:hypothetical protein
MKSSEDLFELIKSLNKQEKRYFKVFASRHVIGEKNNYVKLFDAIENQDVYNEAKIKEIFRNEKFLKQLPVAKNYLYNLILKSLNSFHKEKSVASKINELIESAAILDKKTLYIQSSKALKKARLLANAHQKYPQLVEINNWTWKISGRAQYSPGLEERFEKILKDEDSVLENMSNLSKYFNLERKIMILHQKALRQKADEKKWQKFLSDPLLKNPENALSYEAKNLFHNLSAACHFKLGSTAAAHRHIAEHIKLIESYPLLLPENIERYVLVLSDLVAVQRRLGRYGEMSRTISKLRNLPSAYTILLEQNFYRTVLSNSYYTELSAYLDSCQFEKGITLQSELVPWLDSMSDKINFFRLSHFYFQFAKLNFIMNYRAEAVNWLNKILNDKSGQIPDETLSRSRILKIIVHFELNDFDLLEYEIKSAYRYLSRRKKLFGYEKVILSYIRKTFRTDSNRNLVKLFIELKDALQKLLRDPFERNPLDSLAIIPWLQSKIEKKALSEILMNKKSD